jgi:monovalent cation/hydrogen antiporter
MQLLEILVGLLLCAVALGWLARRFDMPYPIALTLGGIALGFVPGLPPVPLDPNLILPIFLPPILYPAALLTSWRDFRRSLRPISLLAIGLVITTTLVVGVVARLLLPTLPWAVAFAFGAIVSPPDAVAATAVLGRLKMPRRIVTILEGESLVNDASGLVLYKFALAAATTGAFSITQAGAQFVLVAAGGIGIGIVIGRVFVAIHRYLRDPLVEMLLSLALPYTAYLLPETLGLSGVLSVVAAGLVRARYAPEVFSPQTRLIGHAVWNIVVFAMNSVIFILIGLQLPHILAALTSFSPAQLLGYGVAVSSSAIAIRLLWVYPATYIPRWLSKRIRAKEPHPPWQQVTIVGWCGMRGIVSLAAALSLPETTATGAALPGRDLILFLTFSVIVATLVLQGLSLPPLIRWLRIGGDWRVYEEARGARTRIAQAALEVIDRHALAHGTPEEVVRQARAAYEERLRSLHPSALALSVETDHRRQLKLALLAAERRELIRLWRAQELGDEALHEIERELDLEEARLNL